jgi:hypothetical protein
MPMLQYLFPPPLMPLLSPATTPARQEAPPSIRSAHETLHR